MDSELAIRIGKLPQIAVFSGGVKDVVGKDDFYPRGNGQGAAQI